MAGNGSFDERIGHLLSSVGEGDIVAHCEVNQIYAQDQHETPYRHYNGRSHYLGAPLLENALSLVGGLARRVLTNDGSDVHAGMTDIAEKMSDYVLENAPKETGRLSLSGHPSVTDRGLVTYDRPPIMPRREGDDANG